jgi:hypothetical protein
MIASGSCVIASSAGGFGSPAPVRGSFDANPLDDIRNTQRISAVVLGGRLLRRAGLDLLLRQAEEMASRN